MNLTLKSYLEGIENGKLKTEEVVNYYLDKAKSYNKKNLVFVRFHEDYIKNKLGEFKNRKLKGALIGIKDNILTKGFISSFGSNIAKEYISPYSASFFKKLENVGGLMIGKTNMDEFAMGSSTETSAFGITLNSYGVDRIPGGSSGGSAVSVSADLCLASIGTDTAGSVRQPASMCGIVGFKPTYGSISRYGIQVMSNSLDQVGTFTKTVEDSAILFSEIVGYDDKDSTSIENNFKYSDCDFDLKDISGYKIALPKEFISDGLNPEIKSKLLDIVNLLKQNGAVVEEISLPTLEYVLPIYYTLMPAELSTNLSRFDGIRFGLQKNTFDYKNLDEYYKNIRSEGFGEEAKRRIMIGTYVLSSDHYEEYFLKAKDAQKQMQKEFDDVFKSYDIIIGSTTPDVSWKIGEKIDDPIKMYLSDLYTVPANICGLPGMSIPAGLISKDNEQLPWGLNLIADKLQEKKMFEFANWVEKKLGFRK